MNLSLNDLVLIRIAVGGETGVTLTVLRKALESLLSRSLSSETLTASCQQLSEHNLLAQGAGRNRFVATPSGSDHITRLLSIDRLPAKCSWSQFIRDYLFPRAAGLDAAAANRVKTAASLTAWDLKKRHGLPETAGKSVQLISEALVCQRLGYPDHFTLKSLHQTVLNEILGGHDLTAAQLLKQLPLFRANMPRVSADAIRAKYIRAAVVEDSADDLRQFAAEVLQLSRLTQPAERYHDKKVFIWPVWQLWRNRRGGLAGSRAPGGDVADNDSLQTFGDRLLEANRSELLRLGRADLVQTMDSNLVAQSELSFLHSKFHFILID